MVSKTDERHRYGQHYTPPEVARLLAAFAVRAPSDVLLDPGCGDGRLLQEALRLKRSMSTQPSAPGRKLAQQAFGIDRSTAAVKLAARAGARVVCADFFDIEPGANSKKGLILPAQFDAIIGNPPYIRQELIGARDKERIQKRLERDRLLRPDIFWPRWSGRSDIYVFFFAHSARFLRAGGRLVFLTASSWLDAAYGEPLREFLLNNFRIIAIVESARESFFADASINTAITVVEREPDPRARNNCSARFVQLKEPLNDVLSRDPAVKLARSIERAQTAINTEAYRLRVINQSVLPGQGRSTPQASSTWGKYLRADDVFFRVIERGSNRLKRLSDLARVRFGVKTGANEFFYVTGAGEENRDQKKRRRNGLRTLSEVASVRRGLMTGANEFFYLKAVDEKQAISKHMISVEDRAGTRHLIESRYLSRVIFSLKEIPGFVLEPTQAGKLFFYCSAAPDELIGTKALEYIRKGEGTGYHLRPTCSARDPWYAVARAMKPAPLIFPSKVGERWVIALNRARVFEDKKLYGIFPRRGVSLLVLAALLNSTWARYYAEITCRQMTGAQAIADIDVAVAGQIMLPDPRCLSPGLKRKLESALIALARRPALSIFEEIKRRDRRRLDRWVLAAMGFADKQERQSALDQLYAAVVKLVRARIDKGHSL